MEKLMAGWLNPYANATFGVLRNFPPILPIKCPLWVKSRHMQCRRHVRFTPKSGHSGAAGGLKLSACSPKATGMTAQSFSTLLLVAGRHRAHGKSTAGKSAA